MNSNEKFQNLKKKNIERQGKDKGVRELAVSFSKDTAKYNYSYNFNWMGRPIIQFPQDMIAMQEIIWNVKPDLIIETGIAHGGSLIFYASMLELLSCSGVNDGQVIGIDIDIREHNRDEIETHPMFKRITLIEGSSISDDVIAEVKNYAMGNKKILVVLDSNHTHQHVLEELEAYAPLVTVGSYCVVFDTLVDDMPDDFFPDRPWGKDNNPKTAVWEYLASNSDFVIDKGIHEKLLITVAPDGYLKRIS